MQRQQVKRATSPDVARIGYLHPFSQLPPPSAIDFETQPEVRMPGFEPTPVIVETGLSVNSHP